MAFHEIRFPAKLSFGSVGGPERRTEIVTLANGFEERNSPWKHSRRRYDAGVAMRSIDDIETLIAFFEAREGQLHGFRWKDWSDYKSCLPTKEATALDQQIGFGDGQRRTFDLIKTYRSGEQAYDRPVRKPVDGTVQAGVNGEALVIGAHFEVDTVKGQITFTDAPAVGVSVTAGFEFDVPVRFDTDRIHTSFETFRAGDTPNVPILEIRVK